MLGVEDGGGVSPGDLDRGEDTGGNDQDARVVMATVVLLVECLWT